MAMAIMTILFNMFFIKIILRSVLCYGPSTKQEERLSRYSDITKALSQP